jgi:hypothetical protein
MRNLGAYSAFSAGIGQSNRMVGDVDAFWIHGFLPRRSAKALLLTLATMYLH